MQDVLKNPQFEWSEWHLSLNPNIRIQDVLNNTQIKWYKKRLSKNEFTKQHKIFKERVENLAATIIQRFYIERIYKPTHSFIQNKLQKEYIFYKENFY